MLGVQEMYDHCTSRVQELSGNQCQEIGAKIGRTTLTSMAKACPSKSPQVMVALLFLIMQLLIPGPLARLLLEDSSVNINFLKYSAYDIFNLNIIFRVGLKLMAFTHHNLRKKKNLGKAQFALFAWPFNCGRKGIDAAYFFLGWLLTFRERRL